MSVHTWGGTWSQVRGGYPVSGLGGTQSQVRGVPHLRSGGYPVSGLGGYLVSGMGGYPISGWGGNPSQVLGGYPPSKGKNFDIRFGLIHVSRDLTFSHLVGLLYRSSRPMWWARCPNVHGWHLGHLPSTVAIPDTTPAGWPHLCSCAHV